jgi:hypothetical protein
MNSHTQTPLKLRIWQQNMNTSLIAQQPLLNGPLVQRWNIFALQEPYVNPMGNTYCPLTYYPIYPSTRFTDKASHYRSVLLVSKEIDTNHWTQIPFPSKDVTIIQLSSPFGMCTIINIYNNCTNNNTLTALSTFLELSRNLIFQHTNNHMIWLGSKCWWTKDLTDMKNDLAKLAKDSYRLKDEAQHPIHQQY